MLQTEIKGENRIEFLESICTTDINGLAENGSALSLFIDNDTGGILDDFVVTKTSEGYLYLVSNASRRDHDSKLLLKNQEIFRKNGKDVVITFLEPEYQSLVAMQGPKTAEILQPLTNIDLNKLHFMTSSIGRICDIEDCRVTRCGYTGEDGVEISIAAGKSVQLVESLLKFGGDKIKLAGLGARDTLRLEAGLCLYGNDIDETITPAQAGLGFTIGKRRKELKNFPSASIILLELLWGPYKRRVGFKSLSNGPPARQGAQIFVKDVNIGYITSGCPSPVLGHNIAMGYVKKEYSSPGGTVQVQIRDKLFNMEICKLPFVPTKYYTKKRSKA
ncbi:aminomethyltransferase, mitochondrial isoform X2 [Lycorma delicatula]